MCKDLKYEMFENDTCLLKREDEGRKVFIGLYVDNCLIVRDKALVEELIKEIKTKFEVMYTDKIKEFIGCKIEKTNNQILLHQGNLILKMEKNVFKKYIDQFSSFM